jgi:hypothetical protein
MKPEIWLSFWSPSKLSEFNYNLILLAGLYAKRSYGQVRILTHETMADACQRMGVFDEVALDMEDLYKDRLKIPRRNWAYSKLWAYRWLANRDRPFIHIDHDVFLKESLPERIHTAQLCAQHLESDAHQKYKLLVLYHYFKDKMPFPDVMPPDAVNMGIFGGTNLDFIRRYAEGAMQWSMSKDCTYALSRIGDLPQWAWAAIPEQHYLYAMAKSEQVPLELLFEEQQVLSDNVGNYAHLGAKKSDPEIQQKVTDRIIELGGVPCSSESCPMCGLPKAKTEFPAPKVEPVKRDVKWAFTGAKKVMQAMSLPQTPQSIERLGICQQCPEWTGTKCKICGCFTKLKVKIPEEKCPLGKW